MDKIRNIIDTLEERITRTDLYTGEALTRTKADWIEFFAHRFQEWKYALDNLNLTGHDMYAFCDMGRVVPETEYYTRRYLFTSMEDGRVVDIRIWTVEVEREREQLSTYRWHRHVPAFEFRRGPVPGIRKLHGYCGLRYMRTTNERRQNADPEVMPFVRGSRRPNNLVNAYDDIFREETRSWKDNKKVRHQWENRRKGGEYWCRGFVPEIDLDFEIDGSEEN